MLRVGIDLRAMAPGYKAHFGRGIGRYAGELFEHLQGIDPETYGCVIEPHFRMGEDGGVVNQLVRSVPVGRVTLETQLIVPRALKREAIDLFHFVAHGDAPSWSPIPLVVTVLDLIPLRFPELYRSNGASWRHQLGRYLESKAVRCAAGILAISESTRRDVIELLGVHPDRVAVTPLAVRRAFRPLSARPAVRATEVRSIRRRFDLPEERPILLCVGGIDPRKNIHFLLKAFRELVHSSATTVRPFLVFVGSYTGDGEYPALLEAVVRLGISSDVVLLGYLEDSDLISLYQAADLLVFTSLYEGFGFPVLEAFSCGLPVVAGNNSSLPELVGQSGAALLLLDGAMEMWVREIGSLLAAAEKRLEMGRAGVQRAKSFSWEETARSTVAAYRVFAEIEHVESRAGNL